MAKLMAASDLLVIEGELDLYETVKKVQNFVIEITTVWSLSLSHHYMLDLIAHPY